MHHGYFYRFRLQWISLIQDIPSTHSQLSRTIMDETELKASTANLQSIRKTLAHRAGDETNIWAQTALEGLLYGPNQATPVFLKPERTNFFKVASYMPPEIDSPAKTFRVIFGRADN